MYSALNVINMTFEQMLGLSGGELVQRGGRHGVVVGAPITRDKEHVNIQWIGGGSSNFIRNQWAEPFYWDMEIRPPSIPV